MTEVARKTPVIPCTTRLINWNESPASLSGAGVFSTRIIEKRRSTDVSVADWVSVPIPDRISTTMTTGRHTEGSATCRTIIYASAIPTETFQRSTRVDRETEHKFSSHFRWSAIKYRKKHYGAYSMLWFRKECVL